MSAQTQETTPVRRPGWFGPFYYNREDRRIFVPKRWGYGWTFNLARRMTYVIFLALVLFPLAISFAVR